MRSNSQVMSVCACGTVGIVWPWSQNTYSPTCTGRTGHRRRFGGCPQ